MEKNSVELLFLKNGNSHKPLIFIIITLFIVLLSSHFALISQETLAKTFKIEVYNGIYNGTVCVSSITDELSGIHCQRISKNKELTFEYESGVIAIGERFIVCEYEGKNMEIPPHRCLIHINGPESEPEVVDFNDKSSYSYGQILSQQWKGSREWLIELVDVCIGTHIVPLDSCTNIDPFKFQSVNIERAEKLCNIIKAHYISEVRPLLTPDLC
jgi:hypothetical protein